ncbi:MAG: hypothetical protein AB7P02_26635, partial [Alphaproteobacteria bacterium]
METAQQKSTAIEMRLQDGGEGAQAGTRWIRWLMAEPAHRRALPSPTGAPTARGAISATRWR